MPRVVNADEQRARVIEAASAVIADQGFDAATMRGIAARANCTTGFVTHYFANKEELLLGMVQRNARHSRERIDAACIDLTGLDALRAIVFASTATAPDNTDEWRIWVAFWDRSMSNQRLRAEWIRRSEGWQGLVRDALEEAVELGQLDANTDLDHAVRKLTAVHLGVSATTVLGANAQSNPDAVSILEQQLEWIVPDRRRARGDAHPLSSSTKKSTAKKPSTKKSTAKKPSTKKSTAKKPSTKKPTAKKPSTKKPTAK